MRLLQRQAENTPPVVLSIFKAHHAHQLENLAAALLPDLRSEYDKFFTNALNWQPSRTISHVTPLFAEFIKGITYFDDQPVGSRVPVYHRLFSRGTGRDSFRQLHLQCRDDGTMSKTDRRVTEDRIQTCYKERLIYDALFKHGNLYFPAANEAETPQDVGHLHFLAETHKDFQTCFPHMDLRVHVDFDGDLPVRAEITKLTHGQRTSTTIYIKDPQSGHQMYDPFVRCYKINVRGETSTRIQTFQRLPRPWKRITPEAAATMTPTPRRTQDAPLAPYE